MNRRIAIIGLPIAVVPMLSAAIMPASPQNAVQDPVAILRAAVNAGTVELKFEPKTGYLRSLLAELKIDPSSQMLVFSKTSLQKPFISPKNPRAIYFNDTTYVAFVPGAPIIEVMSINPRNGSRFYTIDNVREAKMALSEGGGCAVCHGVRSRTAAPSLFAMSTTTNSSGEVLDAGPTVNMSPRQPIEARWGGWYVTGTHGKLRHLGNAFAAPNGSSFSINVERGANLTTLPPMVDTSKYLNPHSDIVALMVLEQQMPIQNLIIETGLMVNAILQDAGPAAKSAATVNEVNDVVEYLVEAMLGVDETQWQEPIVGTSEFRKVYESSAPKDKSGRSLAELDMKTRLQKYSCSPLIYTKSFDAMPEIVRARVSARMSAILSGSEISPRYTHISKKDRNTIREILLDTKPGFLAQ